MSEAHWVTDGLFENRRSLTFENISIEKRKVSNTWAFRECFTPENMVYIIFLPL